MPCTLMRHTCRLLLLRRGGSRCCWLKWLKYTIAVPGLSHECLPSIIRQSPVDSVAVSRLLLQVAKRHFILQEYRLNEERLRQAIDLLRSEALPLSSEGKTMNRLFWPNIRRPLTWQTACDMGCSRRAGTG